VPTISRLEVNSCLNPTTFTRVVWSSRRSVAGLTVVVPPPALDPASGGSRPGWSNADDDGRWRLSLRLEALRDGPFQVIWGRNAWRNCHLFYLRYTAQSGQGLGHNNHDRAQHEQHHGCEETREVDCSCFRFPTQAPSQLDEHCRICSTRRQGITQSL
jgi:hypothetical protein